MFGIEDIRAKCCIVKLEVARYDVIATNTLIRELQSLSRISVEEPVVTECFEQMACLYSYKSHMAGIVTMLEATITKSKVGERMLSLLNERMPPP